MAMRLATQSWKVGHTLLNLVLMISMEPFCSTLPSISPMPNRPMITGTSPRPSFRDCRAEGEAGHSGAHVHADGSGQHAGHGHGQALDGRAHRQLVIRLMARKMRAVYSGGPKLRAKLARGPGQEHDAHQAQGPADEGTYGRDAQGRSSPALQGHLVAHDAGRTVVASPGTLINMEVNGAAVLGAVIDAANMMMAVTGSMLRVMGSRMEMVATGPRPGSTPPGCPIAHPRSRREHYGRQSYLKAI